MLVKKRPERPQIVRGGLDRVRRPLAVGQPAQVLIDDLDQPQIRPDDRKGLRRPRRQEHTTNDIATVTRLDDVEDIHDNRNVLRGPDTNPVTSMTSMTLHLSLYITCIIARNIVGAI